MLQAGISIGTTTQLVVVCTSAAPYGCVLHWTTQIRWSVLYIVSMPSIYLSALQQCVTWWSKVTGYNWW